MGRYCGAKCRLCRRAGEKLFLKGERCFTAKCAFERRAYASGQHGKARKSNSGFAIRLREKQKIKRSYGLLEKGFKKYFFMATRVKGVTGSQMLVHLESRIDNVVYKAGLSASRAQARQLCAHGRVLLDGKKIFSPSIEVRPGQSVEMCEKMKKNPQVVAAMDAAISRHIPEWIELKKDEAKATMKAYPTREQIAQNFNEQLVVELYSK
jgi:small subunit ribosomal protein S4